MLEKLKLYKSQPIVNPTDFEDISDDTIQNIYCQGCLSMQSIFKQNTNCQCYVCENCWNEIECKACIQTSSKRIIYRQPYDGLSYLYCLDYVLEFRNYQENVDSVFYFWQTSMRKWALHQSMSFFSNIQKPPYDCFCLGNVLNDERTFY